MKKALIVVDVQNDFCKGIPGANEVIKPLNSIIAFAKKNNWLIILSRDWHSKGDHCIKNTMGAGFNLDLLIDKNMMVISKESYSVFNNKGISLKSILKENEIKNVYIGGLTTDYCVRNTAIDSVKNGYNTYVIWDASKGVFKKKSEDKIKEELKNSGVNIIFLEQIIKVV